MKKFVASILIVLTTGVALAQHGHSGYQWHGGRYWGRGGYLPRVWYGHYYSPGWGYNPYIYMGQYQYYVEPSYYSTYFDGGRYYWNGYQWIIY